MFLQSAEKLKYTIRKQHKLDTVNNTWYLDLNNRKLLQS